MMSLRATRRLATPRCLPYSVAILFTCMSFAALAQTPSAPAPTQVPASTFPSAPAPVQQQQLPATPPPKPNPPPPPPATPQPVNPNQTQPTPQTQPGQLEEPVTAPPGPAAPPSQLEQPVTVPPGPAASPSQLQQPVTVPPGPANPPSQVQTPTPGKITEAMPPYEPIVAKIPTDHLGSTYIPVDSWVYPEALRLYSLGYLDSAFINMRPWTRRSLLHMLEKSRADIMGDGNEQAEEILAKLNDYLADETPAAIFSRSTVYGVETVYTRLMGISGQTLRDSYHLGQTIANDYGRPYEPGFNNITGFSSVNEMGRFSLYFRGEYQHAPSGTGYSTGMAGELSVIDEIPYPGVNNYNANQATIPTGTIAAQNPFAIEEATLSFHLLGHEISGGKSDAWEGPGFGGAMDWSNNAEDIYSFRINRVEPLHVPLVSDVLGPLRYDFFFGSLKGHTDPNSPYIHSEMFSFAPTSNFQFAFQRSVIWGGEGHEPVTLHTFLRSFFSINDTTGAEKDSAQDPGARYSDFSFSWRLPFLSHSVTLYADTIAHDDVSPISAPRRAAYRPGVYLSHIPGVPKLDFRVEAASTDTSTLRSLDGQFNYYEIIQKQGYTNKGFIMGDWIGREAKGGQAWLTYHLSGNEWVQLEYLDKKTPKDFVPGGTTQGQFMVDVVKRLSPNVELNAWLQYERWKAPVPLVANDDPLDVVGGPLYYPNAQHDTTVAFQFTWYPGLHTEPGLLAH